MDYISQKVAAYGQFVLVSFSLAFVRCSPCNQHRKMTWAIKEMCTFVNRRRSTHYRELILTIQTRLLLRNYAISTSPWHIAHSI